MRTQPNYRSLANASLRLLCILFLPLTVLGNTTEPLVANVISGSSTVQAGQTHTYTLSGAANLTNTNWIVSSNATVLSSSIYSATIKFNSTGTTTINAYSTAPNFQISTASYNVSVIAPPPVPGNPTVSSNQCGQIVLQRSGTPPAGTTWYWQGTTSNGTSTAFGSGSTYTTSTQLINATYYIRARKNGLWSSGSGSVSGVTIANFAPGSIGSNHTICYGSAPNTLTNNSSASGVDGSYSYQWQYSSTGSSGWTNITGATSATYNPPSGLTVNRWYRRRVISCGETKYTNSIKVTVTGSLFYADTDGDGYGDSNNTMGACTEPSGYVANSLDHDDTTVLVTNLAPQTYYSDVDGDGYGDGATTLYASFKRLGYADNNTDQCPNEPGSGNGCESIVITPSDENYVSTRTYQDATETEAIENVAYFDGLGRTKQNVFIRGSGKTSAQTPNIAPGWTMDWSEGAGGTAFFNRNGEVSENARIWAPDPFGNNNLVWECGNKPDSGSDGGWTTDYFNVDKTKTYRYTVWVRRNHSQNGTTYHGAQNVDNLGGGANSNPYFWSGDLPQLDEWYLLVGIIHPYTHGSSDTGVSGVYDLQGNRVIDGTEYKWRSDTTDSRFRSYLYYCTDVNVRQYFYDPKVEVVDGSELPLQKLFDDGKPKDIVTHMEYDDYGRASKQYLPYMAYAGLGSYRSGSKTATDDHYINTYPGDINSGTPNPYSETQFEASPLNRVLKQAAPGHDWRMGGGHEIEFGYDTNVANEVRHFSVSFSGGDTEAPQLVNNGHYPANALYKKVTYDENHTTGTDNSTEEFTDKLGQVLLKRTYNNGAHDTYYVYDDFGNLTYVLPPKVTVDNVSSTELSELCYQYKYDDRNRLVEKKLPGKDWEYIVYNKLDQPVLSQDANLRANNQWLFMKYDAFGRVAYTGIINNANDRDYMVTVMEGASDEYVTRTTSPISIGGTDVYYTNDAKPINIHEVYTINYYDTYEDEDGLNVPSTVLGQAKTTNTQGLPTVSKVRVLGTTNWITTITGYDVKGRPIYIASKNNYLNTTDVLETKLDFAGKVLQTKTTHTKGANAPIVTIDDFTYDQANRLVKQVQTIGSHTEELVRNEYDELGQLVQKTVGGSLQTVDYTYNVRGWLRQINDPSNLGNDLFAFGVNYNSATHGGTSLYNGNIAETEWKTANDNALRWYRYGYDALNRIENAVGSSTNYSLTNVDYDKNGNITALTRNGHTNSGATTFGTMDNLVYTYDSGNKLTKVLDNGNDNYGFKDGTDQATEYTYDSNGNMLRDLNKGISSDIGYNHLNLPTSIGLGGGTISYIYDATGTKLKKTVSTGGNMEYAGNYVYESGNLQFFSHPEGYVTPDGSGGYDYVYQYTDHLGNVRLSYQDGNNNGSVDATEIVEENNYYPFGLKHKGYNSNIASLGNSVAQRWKFGGKEYDESLGLETYDFGWRNYDAAVGRWAGIDPMADEFFSWSPYNYVYNSPLAFIDPDGRLASHTYSFGTGRIFTVGPNSGGFLNGGGDTYSGNVSFGSSSSGSPGNSSSSSFGQANPSQDDSFDFDFRNASQLKEVVVTLNDESSYTYAALNIQAQTSVSEQYRMFLQHDNQPVVSLLSPIPQEMRKPIGGAGALEYLGPGGILKVPNLIKGLGSLLKFGSRIRASNVKQLKALIKTLSKPGSELTAKELKKLEKLVEKFGGKIRRDLNPLKGKIKKPHVQVEGLGKSVESRHIWLKNGVN